MSRPGALLGEIREVIQRYLAPLESFDGLTDQECLIIDAAQMGDSWKIAAALAVMNVPHDGLGKMARAVIDVALTAVGTSDDQMANRLHAMYAEIGAATYRRARYLAIVSEHAKAAHGKPSTARISSMCLASRGADGRLALGWQKGRELLALSGMEAVAASMVQACVELDARFRLVDIEWLAEQWTQHVDADANGPKALGEELLAARCALKVGALGLQGDPDDKKDVQGAKRELNRAKNRLDR